jgi:hypothetical protein
MALDAIAANATLTRANASSNGATAETGLVLRDLFASNRVLRELLYNRNALGGDGVAAMAEGLRVRGGGGGALTGEE